MPVSPLNRNFLKKNSITTRSAFEVGAHRQGAHLSYPGPNGIAPRAGC